MDRIKVLFIYRNKNIAKKFIEHFTINNYEVYEFYGNNIPKAKLNFWQKIENYFHRIILKNKKQIHKIEERNFNQHSKHELLRLKKKKLKFDFCFVIRGDLVPEFVIKYAHSVSTKMVDFQLDGLSVTSKILDYHKYFDDIFVFDENDISQYPNYPLKHTTNCFFEDASNKNKEIDFLYIGVNTEKRKQDLSSIHRFLESLNHQYNYQFLLTQNQYRKESTIDGITFFEKPLSYEDCLSLSRNAQYVIDLKRKEHDGLSLRFFEALVYKNKIITDNFSVKKYDFYHPNNIYITDFNSFDGLENFLKLPYHNLNHEITDKYNFKYWIKNIFGLH